LQILTLTHARIRAAQGDIAGARRVLTAILERSPEDAEALAMLAALRGRTGRPAPPDRDETLAQPQRAEARSLARRFRESLGAGPAPLGVSDRIRRLESWLERIRARARRDH
jgi:transcriptional regulator GlxA family with amidase domain